MKEIFKAGLFSIISNFILMILKFVIGIVGNSFALVADAIESFGDMISSIFVYFGLKFSHRPPDENHPYGHGKAEPIVAIIVSLTLLGSAIFIGVKSIQNILSPDGILPQWYTAVFLLIVIIWKELSFQWMMRKSKETNSSALKADAWHHRSDALTSLAALLGVGIVLIFGSKFEIADDVAALFAGFIILYNAYKIARPAFGEIMDENVYNDLIEKIRLYASEVEGVMDTEKCIVRKAGTLYHIDLHAIVDGNISVRSGHEIAHRIIDNLRLKMKHIGHVNIHIEPDN